MQSFPYLVLQFSVFDCHSCTRKNKANSRSFITKYWNNCCKHKLSISNSPHLRIVLKICCKVKSWFHPEILSFMAGDLQRFHVYVGTFFVFVFFNTLFYTSSHFPIHLILPISFVFCLDLWPTYFTLSWAINLRRRKQS